MLGALTEQITRRTRLAGAVNGGSGLTGDFERGDWQEVVLRGGGIHGVACETYGIVGVLPGVREGADPKAFFIVRLDPEALVVFIDQTAEVDSGTLRGAGKISQGHQDGGIGREPLQLDGEAFLKGNAALHIVDGLEITGWHLRCEYGSPEPEAEGGEGEAEPGWFGSDDGEGRVERDGAEDGHGR